jgi:hypothetical protein
MSICFEHFFCTKFVFWLADILKCAIITPAERQNTMEKEFIPLSRMSGGVARPLSSKKSPDCTGFDDTVGCPTLAITGDYVYLLAEVASQEDLEAFLKATGSKVGKGECLVRANKQLYKAGGVEIQ